MAKSYNDAARDRIRKSVLQTERRRTRDIAGEARRIGAGQQLVAGVAAEDIEHKEFGNVELATAGTFDSTFFGDSNRVVSVYNPGEKIWAGSELLYLTASLSGTAFASDGIKSVVFNAFSATEIVGTAVAGISPGSTGTLSSLEPLDGHFGESTLQATLPAGAEEIEAGAAVFARLNYDATGSYWRVVSGAAATGGGGGVEVVAWNSLDDTLSPYLYEIAVSSTPNTPTVIGFDAVDRAGNASWLTFDDTNNWFHISSPGSYRITFGGVFYLLIDSHSDPAASNAINASLQFSGSSPPVFNSGLSNERLEVLLQSYTPDDGHDCGGERTVFIELNASDDPDGRFYRLAFKTQFDSNRSVASGAGALCRRAWINFMKI